jgi:very-short-patch-repair endonuclease
VHAGVYQAGPLAMPRGREAAAVLACDATVSHRSAGAFRNWLPTQENGEAVDITIACERNCGRRPGIRVHRCTIEADEIVRLEGIPVTSPARTLLDPSGLVRDRDLERSLAIAERTSPAVRDEVRALLRRYPGRAGTRTLRDLVASPNPPALTRSEAEDRLLALTRRAGLAAPATNVPLAGFEVDFYWRAAKLVVEVDGFAYHGSAARFVRDRQRDSALAAAGIQVLRLSWHQIEREPDKTLVQLALALSHAGDAAEAVRAAALSDPPPP